MRILSFNRLSKILPQVALWAASVATASAGTCHSASFNAAAPAFSVGGSCTLSDGVTISNFRATGIATGGATLPPNLAGLGDLRNLALGGNVALGPPGSFPTAGAGTLLLQYAFTVTPPPRILLTGIENGSWVALVTSTQGGPVTQTAYACVGGVFSSLPAGSGAPSPASCSGSIVSADQFSTTAFSAATSMDVYVALSFGGTVTRITCNVGYTIQTMGAMAQLSSGGGWDTQLTLINKDNSNPVPATLSFFDNGGVAQQMPFTFPQGILQPQTSSTVSETLNPNQLLVLDTNDVTDQTGLTGSAQLTTQGSIDGFAIFRYTPTGQEAVVPLEQRVANSWILAFDNTGGIATGVAIANPSSSAAMIPVEIRDDTGAVIATGLIDLAANGHTSFLLTDPQLGFPATANKRGTVTFGGQISVLGLRAAPIGAGSFSVTTIPVLANVTFGTGSMAQASAGGGWQTTFTLINTNSTTSAQATLAFYDDNGNPLSLPLAFPQTGTKATESTVNATLAAGATMIIVANDPNNADTGSAQLNGSGVVGGFAIYQYTPTGQEAVVPLETRDRQSYLLAFDNTNSIVTGLALANLSSQQVTVAVTVRDDTGATIASGSIVLPAQGHTSFLLTDKYAAAANMRGTVEFDGANPGQISVLGLRAAPTGVNGAFAVTSIPALAK